MSFAGRLVGGTIAVIAVAILILVAGVEVALRKDLEREISTTLRARGAPDHRGAPR